MRDGARNARDPLNGDSETVSVPAMTATRPYPVRIRRKPPRR